MTNGSDIAIALRATYLAMHRRSDLQFASLGITADQFVLLATLARGHALTQRELAHRMTSDPSTVRAMLVLLEKLRLVRRANHPTDSRARTVALTAKGLKAYQKLWTMGDPIRAQIMNSLRPVEAESLVQSLVRVAKALDPDCLPVIESTHSPSPQDESHETKIASPRNISRTNIPGVDDPSTNERRKVELPRTTIGVRRAPRRNRTR